MPDFSKILLPIDLEEPSLPAIHQTAALARHFHSTVVMLHVIRPFSYLSSREISHDQIVSDAVKEAEAKMDQTVHGELDGISVKRVVAHGDPARLIVAMAHSEDAKLIVAGPRAHEGFADMMLGSVTEKILSVADAPVWSCAHLQNPVTKLDFKNILCGVDFTPHDQVTVRWAAAMAADFNAKITLAHVTPGVEIYGPGGYHEVPQLKEALVSASKKRLNTIIEQTGVKAETFIGSGNVADVLNVAAKQSSADLMVIGRRPSAGMMGGNCYRIMSKAYIPVLAV